MLLLLLQHCYLCALFTSHGHQHYTRTMRHDWLTVAFCLRVLLIAGTVIMCNGDRLKYVANLFNQRAATIELIGCTTGDPKHLQQKLDHFKFLLVNHTNGYCQRNLYACCLKAWRNQSSEFLPEDVLIAPGFPLIEYDLAQLKFTLLYSREARKDIPLVPHCTFVPRTVDPRLLEDLVYDNKEEFDSAIGWTLWPPVRKDAMQRWMDLYLIPILLASVAVVVPTAWICLARIKDRERALYMHKHANKVSRQRKLQRYSVRLLQQSDQPITAITSLTSETPTSSAIAQLDDDEQTVEVCEGSLSARQLLQNNAHQPNLIQYNVRTPNHIPLYPAVVVNSNGDGNKHRKRRKSKDHRKRAKTVGPTGDDIAMNNLNGKKKRRASESKSDTELEESRADTVKFTAFSDKFKQQRI